MLIKQPRDPHDDGRGQEGISNIYEEPTNRYGTVLHHADDLASVYDPIQALRANLSIITLPSDEFVPPAKQEVTGDELEPRRKRVF